LNRKSTVVTVVLPEKVVEELDLLVGDGIFLSRSEAIRTAIYILLRKEGKESNFNLPASLTERDRGRLQGLLEGEAIVKKFTNKDGSENE